MRKPAVIRDELEQIKAEFYRLIIDDSGRMSRLTEYSAANLLRYANGRRDISYKLLLELWEKYLNNS